MSFTTNGFKFNKYINIAGVITTILKIRKLNCILIGKLNGCLELINYSNYEVLHSFHLITDAIYDIKKSKRFDLNEYIVATYSGIFYIKIINNIISLSY